MSEYQYYEFCVVDRPLTEQQVRELRALSTRARITSTSFVNTYEWGNFKGDPEVLIERYFDAFVYVANWGTRWFMLRLPRRVIDDNILFVYCRGESARVRKTDKFIILNFHSEDENREWEEEEGWMASLIALRAELLRGDLRSLYLGWLLAAQNGELENDDFEPSVPPGLGNLSAPLKAFCEFLKIDHDLIHVAAGRSSNEKARPSRNKIEAWIKGLSDKEKNALLLDAACTDTPDFHTELLRQFEQSKQPSRLKKTRDEQRRTVGELLAVAKARSVERVRMITMRDEEERERKERENAAARTRYLDQLADREPDVWNQVVSLIQTKRPNDYDRPVTLLGGLRDLAIRDVRERDFKSELNQLRERHSQKTSFLRRITKAEL